MKNKISCNTKTNQSQNLLYLTPSIFNLLCIYKCLQVSNIRGLQKKYDMNDFFYYSPKVSFFKHKAISIYIFSKQ